MQEDYIGIQSVKQIVVLEEEEEGGEGGGEKEKKKKKRGRGRRRRRSDVEYVKLQSEIYLQLREFR